MMKKLHKKSRCFSWLRSTMCEERLNALTMLSVGSCMINKDISFNHKVIYKFIKIKDRRMGFVKLKCNKIN